MPSLDDLVLLLAGIRINERNRSRVINAAGHLVASILKDRWHALTKLQRRQLVNPSANRLWDNYMSMRSLGQPPKAAAKQAITEELELLQEGLNLNQNNIE